jgi:hypothetical protein
MALIGTGIGPTVVGYASDRLAALAYTGNFIAQCGPGAVPMPGCAQASLTGLREAMMLSVLSFAWAGIHYLLAARALREELATQRIALRP